MNSTTPSRDSPSTDEPIRVLFVDAKEGTARAVRPVFEGEFGIDLTVASGSDVSRSLESVDCVVGEIRPSGLEYVDVVRAVRKQVPELPCIAFSAVRDFDLVDAALSAGATDFLRADSDDAGYWLLASRIVTSVERHEPTAAADRTRGAERPTPAVDVHAGSSLLDDSLTLVAVSSSYAELHGYDPAELTGASWEIAFLSDAADSLSALEQRARSRGSAADELPARRRGGSSFSALVSLTAGTDDRYVCTVFDRGERVDGASASRDPGAVGPEREIARLEAAASISSTDESDSIADRYTLALEAIESGTESMAGACYQYDESTETLRRRAATSRFDGIATTLPLDESTPAWNAFVDREPIPVAALLPRPSDPVREPTAARGLVVPTGAHGVLVAGAPEGARPTSFDHAFVRLVGVVLGTALDRVELRRRRIDCERRLETATGSATRLEERLELVRSIARVIGRTWTRDELEHRICERIASADRYAFARIAALDETGDDVCDRAWAGTERGYLERLDSDVRSLVERDEPMACAIRTLEPCSRRRLLTEPIDEPWRQNAISHGYRSVVAVPLIFRERSYGGLAVYSERASAFDDAERRLFAEFGHWIAHAIHAIEARSSLVGHGGVELEFRVLDRGIQFLEWARETGCSFEFETVVSRPDGSIRGFFTIEGTTAETILELAGRSPSVTETRLLTKREGKHLFECTLSEDSVVGRLLEYGVVPKSISASEAAGRLVVVLSDETTVREFVDFFTRLYPDSTLVRRQDREFVERPGYGLRSELENSLTAKQLEALETAFVSGYFEIPRETTGETIAEGLGITQPTFNNHLRVAQRKLLAIVFTDSPERSS
ncbi:bacterio-opsin activator domain-containing protein [Natronolimnohabitans innermongolicus]|uniref:Response regulator receiver modulated GAF sensor protein n=1 Tax=Natronolimnohabitans innermongolicus JCM 12255 TaxID=1227499 RepID=L9WZW5_9EURY|nr:bacterio-opsin activator domain-containing protein [Natronolimnohabitans innermongolicus]ELY54741.1 response regulator receiver modulated GAF sensor protein [Natronolimnohabitans innermongolicus JCM 12255]